MLKYLNFVGRLKMVNLLHRTFISYTVRRGLYFSHGMKVPVKEAPTSALYMPGNKATTMDCAVSPYLDFSKRFENLSDLKSNVNQRGLNINIHDIMNKWTTWRQLECHRLELEEERVVIAKKIKGLKNNSDQDKLRELKQHGKKIREQLKALTQELWDLEEVAVIGALQLPNHLHHSTGHCNKLLFSLFEKPAFSYQPKDHLELGEINGELEFMNNSPSAYYLKKRLAILELACSDYFTSNFKAIGYLQQSNPDFVKEVVVEGCGVQYADRDSFNKLSTSEADQDKNSQHLVGGGSLAAFSAYFTKHLIEKSEFLPQKVITAGRNYIPTNSEFPGLFGCRQSTVVDGFVVHECKPVHELEVLDEALLALIQSYNKLGLHYRVIQYSPQHLYTHESAAIGLQMFSPSTGEYHEVGRVSLCGDYISKRLWTICKTHSKSVSFLSMMHIRVCNVTRLLGLLLENKQKENGTYDIPESLQFFVNAL
ncbi:serine--tRNA synthetase-like protein Slimp isoform X1 [Homarus americanus]|uniref:Serine--tRNA synthetase-like protein Slimp-like n=1 Tax=Homarus americanus TaxID=6706 RepID=A0A8J5MQP6_HOMAM|nr:serine--tRNA synthetase-like protein Slimp isoform X1 [Homarus americanus]XP_042237630.1 serine--tRNA synthetase-like protein Slimp isoform X1 [Homarus americanus]XP_042237631.1 serine--tRNA synthetase-like protein Slimp isoform X1 [Homarus americanus]XP_042237632.1 serine--tRNA synthetase-like protein Slimp isoform X1 [Homarus americanus]XP_042237633.1 serine--tRNA synthetase-like protein Slimp isoform X1 [Homarus americanus]XP_042237634.1 serine--tRNA synthetase-like protein Slimp isoform